MIGNKTSTDIVCNYLSVAVTAVCGAAFSIIISFFYPENVLGRFNTVYSYYIVISQFCVCGIHMAVVKYASEDRDERGNLFLLLRSEIICLLIAVVTILLGFVLVNFVFAGLIGESMLLSFNTIWIALLLFSVNKVFLGWLNGNSLMKAYAFFQAGRNFAIAVSLIIFATIGLRGEILPFCFLAAETVLFILELGYLIVYRKTFTFDKTEVAFKELVWFGIRILPSNAVLELNTKIDVICLSLLLHNESLVGIYSFAAMFGEGFYQLMVVIRKIINPKITQNHVEKHIGEYISEFKRRYLEWMYVGFSGTAVAVIGGFFLLVYLTGKNQYLSGLLPLCIMCLAMVLNSRSIVFGNILAQTGNPTEESVLNILSTACNGLLNIVLIMQFGMIGAAVATGISYFLYSIIQGRFVRRKLDVSF